MNSDISFFALCLVIGIISVTAIDYFGSIISRKLKVNYGVFALFSIFVYTYIPYIMVEKTDNYTLTAVCSLGFGTYDGIVGWKISQKLNAYMGTDQAKIEKLTPQFALSSAILAVIVCGAVGIYMARG